LLSAQLESANWCVELLDLRNQTMLLPLAGISPTQQLEQIGKEFGEEALPAPVSRLGFRS